MDLDLLRKHVADGLLSGETIRSESMNDIIAKLAEFESPNVFNPWGDCDSRDVWRGNYKADVERQNRLRRHFDCKPRYLLIGEAPGYQGCHFSGVPFTSERLISEDLIPRVSDKRFTTREKPWSEPSATIVWKALHELGIAEATVMWNAFAWHPHKPGVPLSNRTPTDAEFRSGAGVLIAILDHFKGATVIPVGRQAKNLLGSLFVKCTDCVRHPANGGATLFRNQLAEIVRRNVATGELIEQPETKRNER